MLSQERVNRVKCRQSSQHKDRRNMTVKEIKTSLDYDKNRPKMNDSAHYLDRQIERFYDAVFEICEDICHSREEATDFIQFIEKEHNYLVQPIAPIGVIESFIAIKDEEGDW